MTPVRIFWIDDNLQERVTYLLVKGGSYKEALETILNNFIETDIVEILMAGSTDEICEIDEQQYKRIAEQGIYDVRNRRED